MTKKKTGKSPRKAAAKKAPAKKTKPKPRRPRRHAAFQVACPTCGVGVERPCLLLAAAGLGHRKRLEQALSFANGVAHATAPHASRVAAYEVFKSNPRPRTPALD